MFDFLQTNALRVQKLDFALVFDKKRHFRIFECLFSQVGSIECIEWYF